MSILVTSTTDSAEAVTAAMSDLAKPVDEVKDKPAPEAKATSETTEESEPSEVTGDETNPKEGDEYPDEAKEDQKPKSKNGFKKRIDKLRANVSDKEREIAYWKAEALKSQAPKEAAKPAANLEPVSNLKPKAESFESRDEYMEALADWKVDQKLKAAESSRRESEVKSAYQKKVTTFSEKREAFAEKHDDFHELLEAVDDIPMSLTVQEVILSSDNGPELMYELAKNRKEYERISALPSIAAARELGKFEAKIASSKESSPVGEKTTKAPKPLNPVGTSGSGIKKSIHDPNISQREYERLREEQIRARRA